MEVKLIIGSVHITCFSKLEAYFSAFSCLDERDASGAQKDPNEKNFKYLL